MPAGSKTVISEIEEKRQYNIVYTRVSSVPQPAIMSLMPHTFPETRPPSVARHETFTEAVPLSLSSMAHASIPLDNGVLDGISQVLQHTLLQCVNYARTVHAPHQWTVRDLCTSANCWKPVKESTYRAQDLSLPLSKMQFEHFYSRNALICLKPLLQVPVEEEDMGISQDWTEHASILGRISLLYITTEPLTQGELDETEIDDDTPPCILYKVMIEYRSLPPTGNQQAVHAEELSMLSFGGSVDDDVKYGALASLYDEFAKYVLEIYSVRGKKYKFDLMDATLSDGNLPRLPACRDDDPLIKSLCVTVTDHQQYEQHVVSKNGSNDNTESKKEEEEGNMESDSSSGVPKFAITLINLLLEGKPRKGSDFSNLPAFNEITNCISGAFLLLNPKPPLMVTVAPSGHTLLLDPEMAGRIYINGRYVTTWGMDTRIGSHGVALFGMDLLSVPFWHGRIVDYEALKTAYASLWHEVLIDARLEQLDIAGKLLHRLMKGKDKVEEDELYDEDDAMLDSEEGTGDAEEDCLESHVLSSRSYDRLGISCRALATRFFLEYGNDAFPCSPHETQWVRSILPDRKPIATPQRLLSILRRGGFKDAQSTADELWFTNARSPKKGLEQDIISSALLFLEQAGCGDIAMEQICVTPAAILGDIVYKKQTCRFHVPEQTYYVHEKFFDIAVNEYVDYENTSSSDPARIKSHLLALFLAQEHPDGRVLSRYMLRVHIDS